jgi:hypothetical protein
MDGASESSSLKEGLEGLPGFPQASRRKLLIRGRVNAFPRFIGMVFKEFPKIHI